MRVRRPTYMGCSNWDMTTPQTLYFPEVWFSQVILWAGRSLHKFNHVGFPKLSHRIFLKETATPRMMLEPMVSNQDIPLHRYTHLFMVDLGLVFAAILNPPLLGTMRHVRAQVGSGSSWTMSTAWGSETLQGSWIQQDSRKIRTSWRCCTSSQFIQFQVFSTPSRNPKLIGYLNSDCRNTCNNTCKWL
jgi:hypothetical protein